MSRPAWVPALPDGSDPLFMMWFQQGLYWDGTNTISASACLDANAQANVSSDGYHMADGLPVGQVIGTIRAELFAHPDMTIMIGLVRKTDVNPVTQNFTTCITVGVVPWTGIDDAPYFRQAICYGNFAVENGLTAALQQGPTTNPGNCASSSPSISDSQRTYQAAAVTSGNATNLFVSGTKYTNSFSGVFTPVVHSPNVVVLAPGPAYIDESVGNFGNLLPTSERFNDEAWIAWIGAAPTALSDADAQTVSTPPWGPTTPPGPGPFTPYPPGSTITIPVPTPTGPNAGGGTGGAGGQCVLFVIDTVVSANTVTGHILGNVTLPAIPDDPNNTPLPILPGDWGVVTPTATPGGLWHLVGKTVTALADGLVYNDLTVSATGTVTLPQAASNITVGLSYQSQLQTLRLDTGDPTQQGKRKLISAMTVRVKDTLGLSVGPTFDSLLPIKDLSPPYTPPGALITNDLRSVIQGRWNKEGQLCFQQDDPLPVTVLGVIPEVTPGDTAR